MIIEVYYYNVSIYFFLPCMFSHIVEIERLYSCMVEIGKYIYIYIYKYICLVAIVTLRLGCLVAQDVARQLLFFKRLLNLLLTLTMYNFLNYSPSYSCVLIDK